MRPPNEPVNPSSLARCVRMALQTRLQMEGSRIQVQSPRLESTLHTRLQTKVSGNQNQPSCPEKIRDDSFWKSTLAFSSRHLVDEASNEALWKSTLAFSFGHRADEASNEALYDSSVSLILLDHTLHTKNKHVILMYFVHTNPAS